MIYLESFHIPSREEDERFFDRCNQKINYPFVMFRDRGMPDNFEFGDITIFCGDNGSGKSTILNVIAEKLNLKRSSLYNRSALFDDYVELCECCLQNKPSRSSAIITSDDVFERVLEIRRLNQGIADRRESLLQEWSDGRSEDSDTSLHGLDDFDRWKRISDSRSKNKSQAQFLRSRLVRNAEERSNGESALSLFVDGIADNTLYLLDEPENSLSPANQLEFKYFIEDCVKSHGCQFIISTHSPFLLSLRGARIFDFDSVPVEKRKWTELDCVRVFFDFFDTHSCEF